MKPNLLHLIFFSPCLFSVAPPAAAQQAPAYYVFDGRNLHVMVERPVQVSYVRWQVWLYPEHVHIPHRAAGLIEGRSAENAMQQLKMFQSFERNVLRRQVRRT